MDTTQHEEGVSGPDVVIYDLAGLADRGTRSDLQHLVGATVVVGFAWTGRPDLERGAKALGVRHLVPEHVGPDELVRVLQRAAGRGTGRLLGDASALTEREVLTLVGAGWSNAQIAAEFCLSVNTIKTNIRVAYRKAGIHTRAQAVLWTKCNGLVPMTCENTADGDVVEKDPVVRDPISGRRRSVGRRPTPHLARFRRVSVKLAAQVTIRRIVPSRFCTT